MKRRLSLAIAAVGDPQIILLDEPTTGLDPKVRQQVWALIERLKKGRSIILTTHSMEEADVLADRVCVMVKGRIKCVGSPVSLKQQYGLGHRLTLNVDRSEIKTIIETLKKLCPSAVMVDYKGGNLVVGVSDFDNLLRLIRML
jgi:ABC-type multidrug transport system ATPase subunit